MSTKSAKDDGNTKESLTGKIETVRSPKRSKFAESLKSDLVINVDDIVSNSDDSAIIEITEPKLITIENNKKKNNKVDNDNKKLNNIGLQLEMHSTSTSNALNRLHTSTVKLTNNVLLNGNFPKYLYDDLTNLPNYRLKGGPKGISDIFYTENPNDDLLDADLRLLRLDPKSLVFDCDNNIQPINKSYQNRNLAPKEVLEVFSSVNINKIVTSPVIFKKEFRDIIKTALLTESFRPIINTNCIEEINKYAETYEKARKALVGNRDKVPQPISLSSNSNGTRPLKVIRDVNDVLAIKNKIATAAINYESNSNSINSSDDSELYDKRTESNTIFSISSVTVNESQKIKNNEIASIIKIKSWIKTASSLYIAWAILTIQTFWKVTIAKKYGPYSRYYLQGERLPLGKSHVVRCSRQIVFELIKTKIPQLYFEEISNSTLSNAGQKQQLFVDVFSLVPTYIIEAAKNDPKNKFLIDNETAFFACYGNFKDNTLNEKQIFGGSFTKEKVKMLREYIQKAVKKITDRYGVLMRLIPQDSILLTSDSVFSKPNPLAYVISKHTGVVKGIKLVSITDLDEIEASTILKGNRNIRKNVLKVFNEQFAEIISRQPYKNEKEILRPLYTEYKHLGKDGVYTYDVDSNHSIVSNISSNSNKSLVSDLSDMSNLTSISITEKYNNENLGIVSPDSAKASSVQSTLKSVIATGNTVSENKTTIQIVKDIKKTSQNNNQISESNIIGNINHQNINEKEIILGPNELETIDLNELKNHILIAKKKVEALCELAFSSMRKTVPTEYKLLKTFKKDIQKILFNLKEAYEYIHTLVDTYKRRKNGDFPPNFVSGWSQQYAETYHLLFSAYTKIKERLVNTQPE